MSAEDDHATARLDGRVCLVTGPTSGIGRVVALELAARGATLILLGRSLPKCEALRDEIVAAGGATPHIVPCDMNSATQVVRAADRVLALDLPIHVLINNAGVINRRRFITADGLEATLAVNYFSAFQLTLLLLDRIKASAPARIINTTSDTYPIGRIDFDDLTFQRRYGPIRAYACSKLATVHFTRTLARHLEGSGVTANVYNPTMIYTNLGIGNHAGPLVRFADFFWKRIAKPVERSVETPVYLASDPALETVSGAFFVNGAQRRLRKIGRDDAVADRLWAVSEALTHTSLTGTPSPRVPVREIRFGLLGAARISPTALIKHARVLPGVSVAAVAESHQGPERLARYAAKYDIPRTYTDFRALLADPDIDAIYLALPISLHAQWTIEAIEAGKHVLCEKPLAANAREAQAVHDAAQASDRVVFEAMHFRHHPLVNRVKAILDSGEIGTLTDVRASFSAYLPFNDFRFNYALGGGCTIDMGCYPIAFLRAVIGREPEVIDARAGLSDQYIDRVMEANLRFSEDCVANVYMGMRSRRLLSVSMKLTGTSGSLSILNFIKPEIYHRLVIKTAAGKRRERVPGGSTYRAQLEAFVDCVRNGTPALTSTDEALKNMRVIDAVYQAAGLPIRGDRALVSTEAGKAT